MLPHGLKFINYNLSAFVNTAKVSTDKLSLSNKSNLIKYIAFIANSQKVNLRRIWYFKCKINLRSCSLYGGFHFHINMNCTTRIRKTILNVGVSKYMYYPNILNFASNRISNKFQFDLLGTNYTHTNNLIQMKITLPQLNITHIPFDIWIEGL